MARESVRPAKAAHPTTSVALQEGQEDDMMARMRHAPTGELVLVEYKGGGRVEVSWLVAQKAVERGEARYLEQPN